MIALRSGCSSVCQTVPSVDRGASGEPKVDGDKILPHQAGELDGGLAVGFHDGVGVQFHGDFDLVVGELDVLDAADFDAGHFHAVADLQILHGVEQRVDVVAALEQFQAAERFDDDHGGEDGQGHEDAEPGFE